MNENPDGILGNLPRSRPGVRSDKRAGGGATPKPPAATPKQPAAKPRAPKQPVAKSRATRPPAAKAAPPKPPPAPKAAPSRDPVEQAVHLVGEVAETGIKVVAKVAVGVLRRLPRP